MNASSGHTDVPQCHIHPRRAAGQALGRFLAGSPKLSGESQPALRSGDLALTSTRFDGGATAEVARRQPDGTWLWVIDQPRIFG